LDHPFQPALGQPDAIVHKREDPASCLGRRSVETIAARGGIVGNHLDAFRRRRPCLSGSHDNLARGGADHLQHVAKRSSRAFVHSVNRDYQAERRRLIEGACIILRVG
jgi:hypothetical protein